MEHIAIVPESQLPMFRGPSPFSLFGVVFLLDGFLKMPVYAGYDRAVRARIPSQIRILGGGRVLGF
jgi:hypothetical protein